MFLPTISYLLIFAVAISLVSCKVAQVPIAPKSHFVSLSKKCQSYGYLPGTPAYGMCIERETRLALDILKVLSASQAANAQTMEALSKRQPFPPPSPALPVWQPPVFTPLPVTPIPLTTHTECYGNSSLVNCDSASY